MSEPYMSYKLGDRVRDINPARAEEERGTGTVTRVEWDDEYSPTVHVQWDNNANGADAHGVMDIERIEAVALRRARLDGWAVVESTGNVYLMRHGASWSVAFAARDGGLSSVFCESESSAREEYAEEIEAS